MKTVSVTTSARCSKSKHLKLLGAWALRGQIWRSHQNTLVIATRRRTRAVMVSVLAVWVPCARIWRREEDALAVATCCYTKNARVRIFGVWTLRSRLWQHEHGSLAVALRIGDRADLKKCYVNWIVGLHRQLCDAKARRMSARVAAACVRRLLLHVSKIAVDDIILEFVSSCDAALHYPGVWVNMM